VKKLLKEIETLEKQNQKKALFENAVFKIQK